MLTATAWKGYKSLIRQYFRTIAEPGAEVNRARKQRMALRHMGCSK
jgi:hypothetical protein